jgi:hypothetical protein
MGNAGITWAQKVTNGNSISPDSPEVKWLPNEKSVINKIITDVLESKSIDEYLTKNKRIFEPVPLQKGISKTPRP